MKTLTGKEEEIMGFFWEKGPLFVKQMLEFYAEPRPHFNTLSTIVRGLEEKGYVGHRPTTGRGYIYYPLLKKEEYSRHHLKNFIKRYFDNSFPALACFFVKENNLSMQELDELLEEIRKGSEK